MDADRLREAIINGLRDCGILGEGQRPDRDLSNRIDNRVNWIRAQRDLAGVTVVFFSQDGAHKCIIAIFPTRVDRTGRVRIRGRSVDIRVTSAWIAAHERGHVAHHRRAAEIQNALQRHLQLQQPTLMRQTEERERRSEDIYHRRVGKDAPEAYEREYLDKGDEEHREAGIEAAEQTINQHERRLLEQ